mgnify:CR=1 FL=1
MPGLRSQRFLREFRTRDIPSRSGPSWSLQFPFPGLPEARQRLQTPTFRVHGELLRKSRIPSRFRELHQWLRIHWSPRPACTHLRAQHPPASSPEPADRSTAQIPWTSGWDPFSKWSLRRCLPRRHSCCSVPSCH